MAENGTKRKIPFKDFFECIQKEYIVAELRSKIYLKEKDVAYYRDREMVGKRKTIEEIAARNKFESIFSNPDLMQSMKKDIYCEWGLPNFIYKSHADRDERRPKDILSYFHKGVEVSVRLESGCIEKGVIVWTELELGYSSVRLSGGEVENFSFKEMARMFI